MRRISLSQDLALSAVVAVMALQGAVDGEAQAPAAGSAPAAVFDVLGDSRKDR
jgi:hypothetical protein